MRHTSHDAKRAAFWLILASLFAIGLVLMFYLPGHRLVGSLAIGFLALLVLKHIGLFLVVGSPLTGMIKVAQVRLLRMRRRRESDTPAA
jgi:hypothetical protein